MKKIPKTIQDKLKNYHEYTEKAENSRIEIEKWFKKQGVNTGIDSGDEIGSIITDIIIDVGLGGAIEEAIQLLEIELNSRI